MRAVAPALICNGVAGSDDVGAALFWRGGVKGAVCACKFEEPCLILRSALLLISFFFFPFFIPEESSERCWAATAPQKPVRHPLKLSSAPTCPFKCYKVAIYHTGIRKRARPGFMSVPSSFARKIFLFFFLFFFLFLRLLRQRKVTRRSATPGPSNLPLAEQSAAFAR